MFTFLSRERLEKSIGALTSRFPVPTLISIFLTLYIISQIVLDLRNEVEIFSISTTAILTFFLSVGTALWSEQRSSGRPNHLFQIIPLLYGIVYYFSFSYNQNVSLQSISFFFLHLAGFIACIFFTPFLTRILRGKEYSVEYSNYFSRVSWTILMSMIVGGSLVALGFIAIGSIEKLFDIGYSREYNKLYSYWATIALVLIAPFYGLSLFPRRDDIESKSYENNRFFAFVIKYIAVPFVLIYFAILYAYSAKVLTHFGEWPKGMIAWLVIGFSSLGYLAYIYSKPYETEGKYITLFRRYFPYAVIPQILMLAYAIYLRINQYGYTMNRYFVVAFGIWLTIISLYFVASKRKILITIPLLLAAISMIISIGPWSVFSYTKQNQETRLIKNLETAKILQNGKIVPLADKKSISKELSNEIYTQIEYLCNLDECEFVKATFPEQYAKIKDEEKANWERLKQKTPYTGPYNYQIINGITGSIGVMRYYPGIENFVPKYISVNLKYDGNYGSPYPIDISGYDKAVFIQVDPYEGKEIEEMYPYMSFDSDTNALRYYTASGTFLTFPIDVSQKIQDLKDSDYRSPHEYNKKDMTYVVSGSGIEIKAFFINMNLKNPAYRENTGNERNWGNGGANGTALIKYVK